AVVVGAEREELVAVRAERAPRAGQMLLDQMEGERVVSGGHGRVGREDRRLADLLERVLERPAPLDQLADPLQHDEARVALVEMERAGADAERLERADAADAEDDLLLNARLAIAAVEARGELAIPRRVFRQVGVEQVQRDAADEHAPDR